MPNIKSIIEFIDDYLEKTGIKALTAVQANHLLNNAELLNDSLYRAGKPLRDLLRTYKIPHAYQNKNGRWYIPHSSTFIKGSLKHEIREIGFEINKIVKNNDSRLNIQQQLRAKKYKLKKVSKSMFTLKGINPTIAFHNGGILEIQFNYGLDWIDNKNFFRYGLAFNLRRGQSLHNPMEIFQDKIKNYNKFFKANKEFFDNLEMWYYDIDEKRYSVGKPTLINNDLGKVGNFIFIGKLLKKDPLNINKDDIIDILDLFNQLMPLYEFVEFEFEIAHERRIARICWNTNGWVKPSGREGKSKADSHERDYGYGGEEWLFDMGKLYKGYRYGFLQPISRNYNKYIGKKYNLLLYTIYGVTKQKYWIGWINNIEVVNIKESQKIYDYYLKKGWIEEFKNDLKKLQLWNNKINSYWNRSISHFNVKFRSEEVELFNKPLSFINNKLFEKPRYILNYVPDKLNKQELIETGFDPNSGSENPSNKKSKSTRTVNAEIEIPAKHRDILNGFMKYLKRNYRGQLIKKESKAFGNSKIDLFRKTADGYIFYEIKSYNILLKSLRMAIGQLLEYNCYPNDKNAIKMYLVSDKAPDPNFQKYINHLNKIINIPFGYIQFDPYKKVIIREL